MRAAGSSRTVPSSGKRSTYRSMGTVCPRRQRIPKPVLISSWIVTDGRLIGLIKYGRENLGPEEAIARFQAEARERSATGSDFLPVTFQYPVAICVLRIGADFKLQKLTCLDAPQFRTREMVQDFWKGLSQ